MTAFTFNRVVIDLTGGVFAGGQTYVALSRCRTLAGVHLKKDITVQDVYCDPRVKAFFQYVRSGRPL